jgi:hypothetical protein
MDDLGERHDLTPRVRPVREVRDGPLLDHGGRALVDVVADEQPVLEQRRVERRDIDALDPRQREVQVPA